jgi:hypothetical protein
MVKRGDPMTEIDSDVRLVQVTKERLIDFLEKARRRIMIAKPGYSKAEIETLLKLVTERQVECTVYVDPDEAVVRYGFGEAEALKVVKDRVDVLNLQTVQGIRLSIVIVDDRALIFTPAALSWEEEPKELAYPNGLEGGKTLVDQLLAQFNSTGTDRSLPENVTTFPTVTIQEIQKAVTKESINQTIMALERNPPVDPAELRKVNFYRNLYKLMKYQIRGVQVKNKTLDLRAFNKLFPESNEHLKRSWQVFSFEDVENISEFPGFRKEILDLVAENTINAGRHGYLIALDRKKIVEDQVDEKKNGFMESLKKEDGPGKALRATLGQSRSGLAKYLTKEVNTAQQLPQALFAGNRILLKRWNDKECSKEDKAKIVEEVIEDFIDHMLKFPGVDVLIDAVEVGLDYYDVSDELLNDEDFNECLEKAGIKPRKYDEGYEKETDRQ